MGVFRWLRPKRRQSGPCVQRTWGVRRHPVRRRVRRIRTRRVACCSGRGVSHSAGGLHLESQPCYGAWPTGVLPEFVCGRNRVQLGFWGRKHKPRRISNPRIQGGGLVRRHVDCQQRPWMFHQVHLAGGGVGRRRWCPGLPNAFTPSSTGSNGGTTIRQATTTTSFDPCTWVWNPTK